MEARHVDDHETSLVLGLNYQGAIRDMPCKLHQPSSSLMPIEPSLTLRLSDAAYELEKDVRFAQLSSPRRTLSPNKSENEARSEEAEEEEEASARKKLRLSKEQSALLENSFREQITLNPKQKEDLANKLNLRPRQVEVWFQNRRARTKLKQIEVDCEFLRRWCETLHSENRRLRRELQELKAFKSASSPLYMQIPSPSLTMCPSCKRITTVGDGSKGGGGGFTVASNPSEFNSFSSTTNSATC